MCGKIDNRDCWWRRPINIWFDENNCAHFDLGCHFDKEVAGAPCTVDKLCCHYIADSSVDDYIKMLLKEVGEI